MSKDNTNANPTQTTLEQGQDTKTPAPEDTLYGKTTTGGEKLEGDQDDNKGQTQDKKLGEESEGEEETNDKKEGEKDPKNNDGGKSGQDELFGKPESGYDYKDLELPEGYELNKDTAEKFNEIAGKYNMSQKGANELMALAVEHTKQTQTKLEQASAQANEAKINSYKESLNKDPEIGGIKLKEALNVANIAYDKFSNNKILDVLAESGLNHHPEVVKMFYNIGKQMENDKIYDGKNPTETPKSHAETLYGNTTKKE